MTLYAIDAIGDAFDATREFLFPFDRGHWLRLALIVFFVGGTGSGFNFQASSPNVPSSPSTPGSPSSAFGVSPDTLVAILLVIAAVVVVFIFAFIFIGSVMEFVFVEALRSDDVSIRRNFRRYWRRGFRLFGFRLLFGLLTLAVIAIPFVVVFVSLFNGSDPNVGAILGAVFLLIAVVFLVAVIAGVIYGFTTMFVVPIMLVENCGVLSAWRRFWPTLRGQWKQYALYVLVELGLSIVAGIGVLLFDLLILVILAIPFGLLAGLVLFVGGGFGNLSMIGVVVLGILAVVFGLSVFVALLLVQVPVQTYFRYYALFVLGDTDDAFDLIPDRRAAVRSDEDAPTAG